MELGEFILILIFIEISIQLIVNFYDKSKILKKEKDEQLAINKIMDDLLIVNKKDFLPIKISSRELPNYKNVREIRVDYKYHYNNSRIKRGSRMLFTCPILKSKNREAIYFDDWWMFKNNKK